MHNTLATRKNNFGLLRLLFAELVIVSHSTELIDGDRSREFLTLIFGTLSFGEVAVDGFFLVSGYLITKSFTQSPVLSDFLLKRVLRIVPGYVVSFLLCVLVVAPLAGGHNPSLMTWGTELFKLLPPTVAGTFDGLPHTDLNGAMWTIAYEFRCYLLAAILGLLSFYTRRGRVVYLVLTATLLLLDAYPERFVDIHLRAESFLGTLANSIRFFAIFCTGGVYFLFQDKITISHSGAMVAAPLLLLCMFTPHLAEPGLAIFGGYLVFWLAFCVPVTSISLFDNKIDISYGLYLYAWPIENLLIYHFGPISPWLLFLTTSLVASLCGLLSWTLVESPALKLARRIRAPSPPKLPPIVKQPYTPPSRL